MKILFISNDGYDDSELLYPYYRLLEEDFEVDIASAEKKDIQGKHFFSIAAKLTVDEVDAESYDALLLPGGKAPEKLRLLPGVLHVTRAFVNADKPVAAICHGQQILISADVLRGRTATCYPGIRDDLKNAGANYVDNRVVVDRNLVTSRRPEDLPFFMKAFIELLKPLERNV